MSYNTEHLAEDFIRYIKRLQAYADHEPHAYKLCKVLKMRVRVGLQNRAYPEAIPQPVIFVQPWYFAGNNDVIRHEALHVMLYWSGLETEIIKEFGPEVGWRVVENLCNQVTAFLQITQPMVDEALRLYGVSAAAVRHLQKVSGADARAALRRLVYDDPQAERAGFIALGSHISDVEQCNWGLPFGWLDQVFEPEKCFPKDANVSFLRVARRQMIGVCWG